MVLGCGAWGEGLGAVGQERQEVHARIRAGWKGNHARCMTTKGSQIYTGGNDASRFKVKGAQLEQTLTMDRSRRCCSFECKQLSD